MTAARDGVRLIEERLARLPEALCATLPADPIERHAGGTVVVTGVGSSAAHARLLAQLLLEHADVPARAVPLSTFAAPAEGDTLVVFSQGLSPNARIALAAPERWRQVVLATAASDDGARRQQLGALSAAGVRIVRFAGEDEYGTLVRVIGPMAGYCAAIDIARALAGGRLRLPPLDGAHVAAAIAAAAGRLDPALLGGALPGLAFVTSGTYGELIGNLQYKVVEGMLLPCPPVWDVLHVAHGPFQELFAHEATLVALARADARGEAAFLDRLGAMLDPARHRLVRLCATLPGPFAIFEHEGMLNALLVHRLRESELDQVGWPGRGFDAPLYEIAQPPGSRPWGELTWRDVEAHVAAGRRTVLVALGSIEQHGPHLPLATDWWIGDALAERLAARLDDALPGPTLTLGCASEHMAFPGTLTLAPATLAALLVDVLRALHAHGVGRAFLFSAHGGNVAPLRAALPQLGATVRPMVVDAFLDLDALTATLHRVAAADGIEVEAAGHHAGECETSILLALAPHTVRAGALAPGLLAPAEGSQRLFYPSVRTHAPAGVVGDPRRADAARGERYLAAWVDTLVTAYRAAKNRTQTKGAQSA